MTTEQAEQTPAEPEADASAPESGAPESGAPTAEPDEAGAAAAEAPKGKPARKKPKWAPPPKDRLDGALEALLLSAGDVLKYGRIRDLLGVPSKKTIVDAVARIRERWAAAGLAVELEEVADGARVVTRPEFAEYVGRLKRRPPSDKLTKSQLETLSIVAYKQPVGRAEVERIRGVQAGEGLRALLERGLVKVVGRSDQPGRPMLYGTTDRFLTIFGLRNLKDLPTHGDLKRM